VTSGAIAGPIVELDLRTLYLKDLTLIGSTRQDPRAAQEAFLEKSHMGKIGIAVSD